MPVSKEAVGKQWPPVVYEAAREKIREYANVIGAQNPVHFDREAALAAGYRDVVAPPMFCVVYSAAAIVPGIFDPDVGINFATMVHGGQEFVWGEPVCAGDELTTKATLTDVHQKDDKGFYVFETESTNQQGQGTVRGVWTQIVRGV